MDRYLIETPHTGRNCRLLVSQVETMGYLHHFEWGCDDNDHTGWAIIEADSKEEALLVVPLLVRDGARVVRLIKFSSEKVREQHTN